MPKIIDSVAHHSRVAASSASYDRDALRNIGDVAAWHRDRVIDDILIGKAAEFKEDLPWEFDGHTYRALLFDRDIAVSYHIDSDVTHYGPGNTWVLTKYHEGHPTIIGKFKAADDFYDKTPIEEAKKFALQDWNKNYANPSERSYLHLAKSNREVLRAALANDGRGDILIRAQMGPGTLPPLTDSKSDELGQSDNGEQPAGTGKHPVNFERPLSGESIPGTGMIGVGKDNMGVSAQVAPPAPPAEPPQADPNAEVGQEAVDPNVPPAEEAAPPVDDGMSLLDAITDAQNALDSIKQKVDSGETVLHGQEVEPVEDAPQPGIQPQTNQPAGAAPITAQVEPRACECESMHCHPNLDCAEMVIPANKTIYGTKLCDTCAKVMPPEYMLKNQYNLRRRGQARPPPLPGAPQLDLPNDEEIDQAFDEATSESSGPPLGELITIYDTIMAQAKELEKQMNDLKTQGKTLMVDQLAPAMRELEGQQLELNGKIRKLVEWIQGSTSYGKVFEELFTQLDDAQKKLAMEIKAKHTIESPRQELRTEKPKKHGDGEEMGEAGVLSALNDVIRLYEQINAAADTVLGQGMSLGAAIDDKVCASCEEGNHQRCSGKGCACDNIQCRGKHGVDEAAKDYYREYYRTYGDSLVEDARKERIALILEMAAQAGRQLSDHDIVDYIEILEDRPMVHGAFLRYATSSTDPTMDDMVNMVFEKSQSDQALSKVLDRITVEHLLKTSDLVNKMTPEEQKAILGRAMRGNKRFYNRIQKLYRRALGIEDPKPVAEPQPPVPQAGPEILTAALKIMAAGMPKMTTPKVRKGEDDAVDVIKMEDAAKDADESVPGQIPFEHEKPVKRGKYLYMTVKWSPEDVKVSGNSLQVAIGNYIRTLVSHRWPTDYGYNGIPVIEEIDPEAGTAVVYFQAATKADAPLAVSNEK